jgi:glycine cleavage system H lipoate-binding protein
VRDPLGLAFVNLADIRVAEGIGLPEGLAFLPIDKNGNGSLDYMEDIYGNANELQRGAWIGKYPRALCGSVYAVSENRPDDLASLAFLKWVVTSGQKHVATQGLSDIVGSERESQLGKISTAFTSISPQKASSSLLLVVLISLSSLVVLSIIITAIVRRMNTPGVARPEADERQPGLDEGSVKVPEGLYFDKTHTWAFMEKDGKVAVGIDDFLQHITGPITRVEMKKTGERIRKGELLFSLKQSGKQLNIYSPVSGKIAMQNEALISRASILNTSPYAQGWIYMVEPDNWPREVQLMEMAGKYRKWIESEFTRVKDFLAATLNPGSPAYVRATMQDGGVLKEGVLADLGPEVWEDFQAGFLDTAK